MRSGIIFDIFITCRNLIPRIAEVAKTLENTVDPLNRTTMEADTTIKSKEIKFLLHESSLLFFLPIKQIGFLMNLNLPETPM